MNNEQFRKLLASNEGSQNGNATTDVPPTTEQRRAALGSRARSIMPMTPRTVKGSPGINFARQVADNGASYKSSASSKFRSSAPRGSQLAQGYNDRTKERNDEDQDDTAKQVKALEDLLKKGDIEQSEFDRLRDEITGGDIQTTHLVKGLDWKLLERVRKGEDVHSQQADNVKNGELDVADVDEAFDDLESRDVVAIQKIANEKKGQKADPAREASTKKTRNEILAELKASRQRAANQQSVEQSSLTSKFRRIGAAEPTSRLQRDERGREVLIVTDADGNEKRKVRKSKTDDNVNDKFHEPAMKQTVLGADLDAPEVVQAAEESDDDIYADVGDDYNPLGDMDDDDNDSEVEQVRESKPKAAKAPQATNDTNGEIGAARNYFQDGPSSLSVLGNMSNPLQDPAILAALAKKNETNEDNGPGTDITSDEAARLKRKAEILSGHDRDLDDMDMGFGSSRYDDAAEMDGLRVKISEWKDGTNDDDDGNGQHERKQRKRGPKKRKGDKNNINDVLKVMERQKR